MLVMATAAVGQNAVHPPSGGISGVVRYPNGMPSAGATVSAVTQCEGEPGNDVHFNYVQEVKTSTDGSFYIPPFSASVCNRVRLSAKLVEDLWLKTGHDASDIFYEGDNGTAPVVEAARLGSPTVTEITLGARGGQVAFRVRDLATGNFIWAGLYLERIPVCGAKFGSVMTTTGQDGSAVTELLPAGNYRISVERYSCRGAHYFTANPPQETIAVEAGQRVAKDISVDVRLIKPEKIFDNPRGKKCKP